MADIDRDHFIRTTEPDHRFAVQHFWVGHLLGLYDDIMTDTVKLLLKHRGYIYASKHTGWYSVSDETYYPESAVRLTLDPSTGRKFMVGLGMERARDMA